MSFTRFSNPALGDFVTGTIAAAPQIATGALGYAVKPRLGVDLGAAINAAHAGRSYLSPSIAPKD